MNGDLLDEEARALLQQVFTGERAADDAAVLARSGRDPAFAKRLDDLHATVELLESTANESRTVVGAARALQDTPGEQDWHGALGRSRRPRSILRRVLWTGAAAAGIAVALFLGRDGQPEQELEQIWMGGKPVHIRHPRGMVAAFVPIRWEGRLPARGEYRITIEYASSPSVSAALQHRTTETLWTPSPEDLSLLGDRIRVDVSVFVDGQRIEGDSSEAWR